MCRIFGFRSILQSGVHRSLVDSDNAIIQQSQRHLDGWGVAFYNMGTPHLVKNDNQALECKIFEKLSGVVSSNTVLAHIRKSTVGAVGPLNTHPFQYGHWVFAHNGNIENFDEKRSSLMAEVDPELGRYILGDTDSELIFYLLLSHLKQQDLLIPKRDNTERVNWQNILQGFVETMITHIGELSESKGEYEKNYLTFVLTNGRTMIGFNGGQQLFFSTHKTKCPERDSCAFFQEKCEKPAQPGDKVHHLLLSSEKIQNENSWSALKFGEFVAVDDFFMFQKASLKI